MVDKQSPAVPAEPQPPHPDESEAGTQERRAMPAIFCDSFWVISWSGLVRISLGEFFDRTHYRTAVVMPVSDAEELAQAIMKSVERARAREAEKGSVA